MKNENIAKVLKKQRKLHNMSVKEVSKELEKRSIFVAEKTIYGWESGQSQPDADTFLILCDIYNIVNILEEFGYTQKSDFVVTNSEQDLIVEYRKHPELHQAINKLLDIKKIGTTS